MSVKIDPEGPRRSKKDPVRLRKLRQTSQAAFAASSFSSWLISENILNGKIRDNPTYGCNDEKAEHCAVSLLNDEKCQMFYACKI